jgi:hypothetical protein
MKLWQIFLSSFVSFIPTVYPSLRIHYCSSDNVVETYYSRVGYRSSVNHIVSIQSSIHHRSKEKQTLFTVFWSVLYRPRVLRDKTWQKWGKLSCSDNLKRECIFIKDSLSQPEWDGAKRGDAVRGRGGPCARWVWRFRRRNLIEKVYIFTEKVRDPYVIDPSIRQWRCPMT